MKLLLKALVFSYLFSAQASEECSLVGIASLCSSLPESTKAFVNLPNGQKLLNPNGQNELVEPMTSGQRALAREKITRRIAFVKEQMKKEILAGRNPSDLTSEQKVWFDRINKITVNIENCEGNTLTGHYDSFRHQVSICLRNGLTSDGQLTWILAHEAAHSIDGCSSQESFYKRNSRLPTPSDSSPSADSRQALAELNGGEYFLTKFDSYLSNPQELSSRVGQWRSAGLIEMMDGGIEADRFPLSPVLACLRNEGLIARGAEVVKPQDCGNSVVSETPSDMWGARIAGQYLKLHPPSTALEKLATLSNESIKLMCNKRTGPKPPPPLNSPNWEKSKAATLRYISDRYRDEATKLSDSNIQNALGCTPQVSPRGQCMGHFEPSMKAWNVTPPNIIVAPAVGTDRAGTAQ